MRVFVPATLPLLARWAAVGGLTPQSPAYAVTPAVREWYRDGDLEQLEHVAQVDAGRGSIELLAHDPSAPRRRVVVAVEVAEGHLAPASAGARTAVRLTDEVPQSSWTCVYADPDEAAVVVSSAVAALGRAALGDDDAAFDLDEADAAELGWYAVQEVPALLADAGLGLPG